MWTWPPQSQHSIAPQDVQTNSQIVVQAQTTHPTNSQTHELSDMLQMLQDQGGASGFEDLNMFNTNFE